MCARYKIKTEEITQQAAKREALEALNAKTESTDNLKAAFGDSQQEYMGLKQVNADLCYRLSQLEEELDSVRRENGLTLDQRERDIGEMRHRLQELMNDYDELMNNKASLEFEINTYRRLLESEETRTSRMERETSHTRYVRPQQAQPQPQPQVGVFFFLVPTEIRIEPHQTAINLYMYFCEVPYYNLEFVCL